MTFEEYYGDGRLLCRCDANDIAASGYTARGSVGDVLAKFKEQGIPPASLVEEGICTSDLTLNDVEVQWNQHAGSACYGMAHGDMLLVKTPDHWVMSVRGADGQWDAIALDVNFWSLGGFRHLLTGLFGPTANVLEDRSKNKLLGTLTRSELRRHFSFVASCSSWGARAAHDRDDIGDRKAGPMVCYKPSDDSLLVIITGDGVRIDVSRESGFTIGRLSHLLKAFDII